MLDHEPEMHGPRRFARRGPAPAAGPWWVVDGRETVRTVDGFPVRGIHVATRPHPPGTVVLDGPFDTADEAQAELLVRVGAYPNRAAARANHRIRWAR
jgi:hypothetical protein